MKGHLVLTLTKGAITLQSAIATEFVPVNPEMLRNFISFIGGPFIDCLIY